MTRHFCQKKTGVWTKKVGASEPADVCRTRIDQTEVHCSDTLLLITKLN